jgi:hypothetical protein
VASDVQSTCNSEGIENILHNKELVWSEEVSKFLCTYSMGEHFLLSLLKVLGEERMSSALAQVYLSSVGEGVTSSKREAPTEEEIYQTFMEHAPTDREEEVRELYQRLHGGLFAFPIGDVEDEDHHGDTPETAIKVRPWRPVSGAINDAMDYDYFRFNAQKGESYSFEFYGDFLSHLCSQLYRADGTPVSNWYNPCERVEPLEYGREFTRSWTAQQEGRYYLALNGLMESVGGYKFVIVN